MIRRPPRSTRTDTLFPYPTLCRSSGSRSVAADVSLVDVDSDGLVDYAYAADTGGAIYRMDFINGPATRVALAPADWSVSKVAYTSGGSRKFLFPPALLNNGTINYLARSEEHTSELQSLMRISYAVFCLKKK